MILFNLLNLKNSLLKLYFYNIKEILNEAEKMNIVKSENSVIFKSKIKIN